MVAHLLPPSPVWLMLLIVLVVATGCEEKRALPVTPEVSADEYNVGLLFEVDGCRVYRFNTGGARHYFASCGSTSECHSEARGKTTVRVCREDVLGGAR